jgi:hypothetical protein
MWSLSYSLPFHLGSAVELLLPVVFMINLIQIKYITNVYDSPNIAYYCGNVFPWFYTSSSIDLFSSSSSSSSPMQCTQKPLGCSSDKYYQQGFSLPLPVPVTAYTEYGYLETPASAKKSLSPFYTFTIADESTIYNNNDGTGSTARSAPSLSFENPSLPFCSIVSRLHLTSAILAVAPNTNTSSSLTTSANHLFFYLSHFCDGKNVSFSSVNDSLIFFSSEKEIDNYITNKQYDNEDYELGKVAFAIILNSVDENTAKWDYSIRTNYTDQFHEDQASVACLYGGTNCPFRYSIPTTKYFTYDLLKPQSSQPFYGYSYSGFLTLQQVSWLSCYLSCF